uniref:arsenite methyltransferase-like n=1 Tax=Pristiophorus japonicus TaxID=55135 RepID=UPI00398F8C32
MAQKECCGKSLPSPGCSEDLGIHEDVKDYYGKKLKKTEDLVLNVCVTPAKALSKFVRDALKDVHEEVVARSEINRLYIFRKLMGDIINHQELSDGILRNGQFDSRQVSGYRRTLNRFTASHVPYHMHSRRMLSKNSKDLETENIISKIDRCNWATPIVVVPKSDGKVQVAQKFIDYHTRKFGFSKPNVDFLHGYIEKLAGVGLEDNSFDIIISNCVVNLSPDKRAVLKEAYRVLKDGGEMYFSDVYADRDLPETIRTHKVLWGECLGGALWWKELFQIAEEVGFNVPRLTTASRILVKNKELEDVIGDYKFVSATYRLFKIPDSSPREKCRATYNGSITGCKEKLEFDINYTFNEGEEIAVDEEMAAILKSSRFANAFIIQSVGKAAPCTGECPPTKSKDTIIDPFKLTEGAEIGGTPSCAGTCSAQSKGCC